MPSLTKTPIILINSVTVFKLCFRHFYKCGCCPDFYILKRIHHSFRCLDKCGLLGFVSGKRNASDSNFSIFIYVLWLHPRNELLFDLPKYSQAGWYCWKEISKIRNRMRYVLWAHRTLQSLQWTWDGRRTVNAFAPCWNQSPEIVWPSILRAQHSWVSQLIVFCNQQLFSYH